MEKIVVLTNQHGFFGSKFDAEPYLTGFDLGLLSEAFKALNYEIDYRKFQNVYEQDPKSWKDTIVLYTSSEDTGYKYKEYIEDIILYLSICGAQLFPNYWYLRANNNKVFMELLSKIVINNKLNALSSNIYGSYDELIEKIDTIQLPVVIKESAGAQSRGVYLAKTKDELKLYGQKVSRTKNYFRELWEIARSFKYKNYTRESRYRNKFITQQFIPNLKSDFKILVYGDMYYILERAIRRNDFRASGSKFNYKFGSEVELPPGILDFAESFTKILSVPNVSLDVGFDGKDFYVFEFQAIYFGSSTHLKSDGFYKKEKNNWVFDSSFYSLEYVYAYSVNHYLSNNIK